MELLDSQFFKPFHEIYSEMAVEITDIKTRFVQLIEDKDLEKYSIIDYNYRINSKPYFKFCNKQYKNNCLLLKFDTHGTYLTLFNVVEFTPDFLKLTDKIKVQGILKEKEIDQISDLQDWIAAIKKTSLEEINNPFPRICVHFKKK